MKVERDLAGITLPFTAGTAAVLWFGHVFCTRFHLSSTLAFSAVLCSAAVLLHHRHISLSSAALRIVIGICMAACGIICGITSEATSAGGPLMAGIMEAIGTLGQKTGEMIDSIGFRNPDTNAIIKALIIGDRTDIPKHITDAFRESGASHILALSGLHLGIIYGILTKLLSVLGNRPSARAARSMTIVLACGLYTLATGAGASIVRAFLFILIGETARLCGRFKSTGTVLMAALLIHLTLAPSSLREVGFQLSYAAMAGIAFIYPRLKNFWPEQKARLMPRPLRWMWNTAAMSISCQLTTGPLAYIYFRTFPVHFLLTNMIALPLTGLIIPAALLTLALSAMGICPDIVLRASEALVTALSEALKIISVM